MKWRVVAYKFGRTETSVIGHHSKIKKRKSGEKAERIPACARHKCAIIHASGTIAIPPGFLFYQAEGCMGIFSKDIKTMDDLFLHSLQDIYYAERQITKALPKMIDKATNRDLATGLKAHLEETNKQIERLEKVFEKLGRQPSGTQCPAIDGIIKEGDEVAGEVEDKAVLDAALVAAAQAVEHYEICRYGTLIAWAGKLGHDEVVRFLTTSLNEEKAANTKLNTLAMRRGVNTQAANS